ncbi:MAG: relaxase/mobilization nuclease domain-containing protein [Bacteroides sp.]|uniref:relaxase/mobilization nuclease domain-containing protein n=1 Tax=Bacteroides sp. TaxID=29523 RepID=UPI0026DEBA6D|nr:relaxase/mobilization nuclease domain-containing protein [Bacteroides sp.]MDO5419963.1 relaxase/mobilization nuclease domain-containing protein [Bacteroides sp.]
MMSDLKKRASFARVVNYVNNPKKARLIDSKDVRLDDNTTIARSMQGQADDKPGRKLKNPVYHISLDFAHEDAPKLTDALMVEIAREYMRRMGITNTQYIVSRHTDREHQHLHIVANRVDNNGNAISDSNDNVRNVKVCKALTREYGLHFSKGKMNVKRDRLRGKDKVKYQIYDAVKAALPHCNCWSDLCDRLAKQGIGVNFKYNRNEGKIIGVSFTKNEISFSGSRIDRSMSFYKLHRLFGNRIAECMEWQPRVPDNGFDGRTQPTRQDVASDNHAASSFIKQPSPTGTETDGNGGNPAEFGSNIVQVTIGALMELCVQPHQAKVSSGGGGGGNESGWGDNDNEKNKYKPKRRGR